MLHTVSGATNCGDMRSAWAIDLHDENFLISFNILVATLGVVASNYVSISTWEFRFMLDFTGVSTGSDMPSTV